MSLTVNELAERLGATVQGNGDLEIRGCSTLEEAGRDEISFLANPRYKRMLRSTGAGAVLLSAKDAEATDAAEGITLLIADDPYFAFREAVVALHGYRRQPEAGISELADVHPKAVIGEGCCIEPFVYIAEGAVIGDRTVVHPHCYVGAEAKIGSDCILYPNVTVYEFCVLGDRVILQAGCVIGQDGFGYATAALPEQETAHHKIPQVGNAVIEDDVELGANCAIDRATVGSTVIGAGTKFSDLIAIGHGAKIGRHNLMVAQSGIAGSTETGKYVTMGGQVGIAGHLKIGDMVQLAAMSGVYKDLPGGQKYGGAPALPLNAFKRVVLQLIRLPEMADSLRDAHKQIELLQEKLDALDGNSKDSSAGSADQSQAD